VSHMSAVGFAMTPEALHERVLQAAQDAPRFDTPIGAYLHWALPTGPGAGVELWLQVNAVNQIVGCNPHYAGQGRLEAAIIETVTAPGRPLDGHCFGWAAPRDPDNPYSGIHSIAANLPDFAYVDERILIPPVVTLQIAAFASYMEHFPTETAFVESEWGRRIGAQSATETWQQVEIDGLPQPEVFLSGKVIASEAQVNPATGQEFQTLVLRTEAGTIDVVSDLATSPRRPAVGTVAAGSFWLSARVIGDLPAPRTPSPFLRARAHS